MADFSSAWSSTSPLKFNPQFFTGKPIFTPSAGSYSYTPSPTPPSAPAATQDAFSNPLGDLSQSVAATVETQKQLYPIYKQGLLDQAQTQFDLNAANLQQTYPYLSQAAAEATARNLAASKSFLAFKEQQPSNIANIMYQKQAQAGMASTAEYQRALGMAAQAEAAKKFVGLYVGQTFQVE